MSYHPFINSWYLTVTDDVSFVGTLKFEVTSALRKIAVRYRKVDYAHIFTTKLLPIVYNHFNEIENIIEQKNAVVKFVESNIPVHPATLNRRAEIQYLRALTENIIPLVSTSSNLKCRPAFNLVRELLSNMLLLPLTDLIADPNTLNLLVVLATNPKTTIIRPFTDEEQKDVEFLEHFQKSSDQKSDNQMKSDFFKEVNQESLYNFMHFLRNKSYLDVEILKFVLDVDHLNAELAKSHTQPSKLSELSSKSEQLLKNYRDNFYRGSEEEKPKDLQTAYLLAKSILEHKWKHDFYKSAEFYKLTYGEREIFNVNKFEKDHEPPVDPITSQRLSTKIRNAMAMKVAVDGIEEDIQVWDALDATMTSPSYYNSMTVKLRKERGQDLETFMQTFYNSTEQEGDVGEDISAQMQTKSHRRSISKSKIQFELYQNLFNLNELEKSQSLSSFDRTPTQSLLYFLAKIIKVPMLLLRIITGILMLLPDTDSLVLKSIRKVVNRLVNQAILAYLVKELKLKLFESKSTKVTQVEIDQRKKLAHERLEKIRTGLSENLKFLQNPIINKHLVYSLLDVVISEGFPELDPHK